jgi:hypothetical protein
MTTSTNESKKIKIAMSGRRPIRIVENEWPLIAGASRASHDGNREWRIRVLEHEDGRRIVYGWSHAIGQDVPYGWRRRAGGFLVVAGDEEGTVRAIRRVARIIDDEALFDECVADLPAQDVDAVAIPAAAEICLPRESAMRLLALLNRMVMFDGINEIFANELRAAMARSTP